MNDSARNSGGLPERLWHYTNGVGAQGIVLSRTLRAGHLGFMNDTSEVGHAMNESRTVVKALRREFPNHEAAFDRWINYLTDHPPKSWAPNVFAVSFSEEQDLLSQWRGYASGPGGSFCLGFLTQDLNLLAEPDWSLSRCIYSRDEQHVLLEERIRLGLRNVDEAMAEAGDPIDSVDMAYSRIYSAVMTVAPLCKHPAFAEEKEWRLVTKGPVTVGPGTPIQFTPRPHNLAPFVEFYLTERDEPLRDLHWIAGPGPQQERANQAMGWLARTNSVTNYRGWASQVPFLP